VWGSTKLQRDAGPQRPERFKTLKVQTCPKAPKRPQKRAKTKQKSDWGPPPSDSFPLVSGTVLDGDAFGVTWENLAVHNRSRLVVVFEKEVKEHAFEKRDQKCVPKLSQKRLENSSRALPES